MPDPYAEFQKPAASADPYAEFATPVATAPSTSSAASAPPISLAERMQRRAAEMGAESQRHANLAWGPEARGTSTVSQVGHALASGTTGIAQVVDKVVGGFLDPKTLALALAAAHPATRAAVMSYFATQGTAQLTGLTPGLDPKNKSPESIQNWLLTMGMVSGSAAGGEGARAPRVPKPLTEMARKGLTTLSGAGPERTTEPLVEEFKAASSKAAQKQAVQDQRATLTQTINKGSKQFGEGVKELSRKVKAEQIDPQYEAIRKATAADPGEPLAEIAKDARTAEGLIKGSTENIKQFRELLRKAPETEGVQTSAGFTVPGEPLYEQLVSEGAIDTGGKLPYSDLQGYSTELGDKLRKGGMPDDVYRAIKYLKEKIDIRKQVIADRNGVGPQLIKANADYTHYVDTFFEKPSAIAATLDRVGKLDPEHYAAPVISGKAAQLGILRLRHYGKDFPQATQLAEQAESLRNSDAQLKTLPKQRTVEQPKPPTLEDVKARKTKEVKSEAREIGRLNRWDASLIAGSAIGPFFGRWETLLIDPAYLLGRKSLGKFLDRPAVLKWLAEPSPDDLRILNSLPAETKAEIGGKMTDFIVKERNPVQLSLGAKQFLGPVSLSMIAAAAMNKRQTPDTASDVMRDLKGLPPGRQKKDLQAIQQKYANPMLPVGSER